tara:strand:- start:5614 stop:6237 length:624 start_codon:yes stop_codon:yes gene_type:complete
MRLDRLSRTWNGALTENRWHRLINLVFAVALVLALVKAFTVDTIVTIKPYTLNEDAWVSQNQSSQSYKESWGMLLASLTGNVTPGSVNFVKERIEPLLSPQIYRDVMEALEVQALSIRRDRVTMRFEPRAVEYEPESDVVFVYGNSYVQGATGDPVPEERTYEYIIDIRNYAPVVTHIETYSGRPRTERVRQQMERQLEREEERNRG